MSNSQELYLYSGVEAQACPFSHPMPFSTRDCDIFRIWGQISVLQHRISKGCSSLSIVLNFFQFMQVSLVQGSVMNKFSTSVDVLLLEYSIFLALSVRSDVAEMVMDREFLKDQLKACSMFCCCFSIDSDMNGFFSRMLKSFCIFVCFLGIFFFHSFIVYRVYKVLCSRCYHNYGIKKSVQKFFNADNVEKKVYWNHCSGGTAKQNSAGQQNGLWSRRRTRLTTASRSAVEGGSFLEGQSYLFCASV